MAMGGTAYGLDKHSSTHAGMFMAPGMHAIRGQWLPVNQGILDTGSSSCATITLLSNRRALDLFFVSLSVRVVRFCFAFF